MSTAELALMAALVGAVFAFLGNLIPTSITRRAEERRQAHQIYSEKRRLLLQLGFELGMKEYDAQAATIKSLPTGSIATQPPPQSYVYLNMRFLELVEAGTITPEAYTELLAERDRLNAVMPILKIITE